MKFEVAGLELRRCPYCWVQEQTDLVELLHDHGWRERALPREGGFLRQDARWVDAMNVIDAALARVRKEKASEEQGRSEAQALIEQAKRKHRRR